MYSRTIYFQPSVDEVSAFFPHVYTGSKELKMELNMTYQKRCWERWELEMVRKQFKDAGGQPLGATIAWEGGGKSWREGKSRGG